MCVHACIVLCCVMQEKKMTSGTTQTVIQTPQEAQITDADDWYECCSCP